ncbi:hypothetical protein CKO37_22090 [Rubrivivax gelatinosus]|nr:hypothetical protein [Rubrivivax gelatinosus]
MERIRDAALNFVDIVRGRLNLHSGQEFFPGYLRESDIGRTTEQSLGVRQGALAILLGLSVLIHYALSLRFQELQETGARRLFIKERRQNAARRQRSHGDELEARIVKAHLWQHIDPCPECLPEGR